MMINKRLIGTVSESKKYIAANVLLQWCALAANILLMFSIARLLSAVFEQNAGPSVFLSTAVIALCVLLIRLSGHCGGFQNEFPLLGRQSKKTLREKIYQKLLKLGSSLRRERSGLLKSYRSL